MNYLGQAYFWMCAALAVAGALVVVTNQNPIRGAMGLLMTILSIAGLFLALHAQFLAAIQLIVYAGAIVVLFLFVIMLLGPSAMSPRDHRGRFARTLGSVVFGLSMVGAGVLAFRAHAHAPRLHDVDLEFGSIDAFGRVLFADALVPFELSSALLLIAVVGAVAVARGKQPDKFGSEGGAK
jgi:NADH-quinone oxidoreductase subunit J